MDHLKTNVAVHRGSRALRRAFTLVELLVVIGIIALLISVLLPALNKARSQSQTVKCLANLKQIGLGFLMYMGDSKGFLPPIEVNGGTVNGYWTDVLTDGKYIRVSSNNNARNIFICPSANAELCDDAIKYNSFDPRRSRYADSGLFWTPGPDYTNDKNDIRASSYAVNGTSDANYVNEGQSIIPANSVKWTEMYPFTFVSFGDPANKPPGRMPVVPNVGKVHNPTLIPLVYDGIWMHAMSPRGFILRHGKTSVKRPQDRQCNMVFLDGHAESVNGAKLPNEGLDSGGAADPAGSEQPFYGSKMNMQAKFPFVPDGTYKSGAPQFTIRKMMK